MHVMSNNNKQWKAFSQQTTNDIKHGSKTPQPETHTSSFTSALVECGEGGREESESGERAGEELSEGGGVYGPTSRSVIFWLPSRIL